jgi:hypothetical protein
MEKGEFSDEEEDIYENDAPCLGIHNPLTENAGKNDLEVFRQKREDF